MKKQAKYILITLTILIFTISCKKSNNSANDTIKLPFDFTHYGVILVNIGIKEIHDTLGVEYKDYYFDTNGKLISLIDHTLIETNSSTVPGDPIYKDTTIILDQIVYNSNNQLIKIGNATKNDVYSFEYIGNNLSKVIQKFIPLFVGDTASLNKIFTFEFTSNNSDNFISSIYNYSSCPFNRTYHYNQNKLDSIVSNISTINCPGQFLIIPSIQFFYENDKIIRTKTLTNLGNYNTDNILIYTNNKLTEIKQPYANAQGAPHTTFIYY
jgi:hypothetical protein